ncbi:unnamed protein product [Rotaria socialis]|uniref:Uncharacterized protein n=1 Tax=Rotaria socialis TaxID=392032 RepID=A0A818T968_9BILA|nr:unnamed protein product [Rotaria socialis]
MYQHIRIALEYAQQRSQHVQEQENIRRCRKTIEKYPTARANEDETTSNNPTEISHHSSTDDNETLDVDNDFDLDSVEEISNNLKQCNLNYLSRQNNNNDIIFNQVYKELQSRRGSSSSISLLLHLDGISLCKSSKLNLWLLSCSLIELPVHLRYRRFNVIVLSVWIGHCEPLVDLWLEESFQQLNDVKKKSISTRSGINYKIIVYGLAGDCPAIKLPTKHISHQGYICCWLCYTHACGFSYRASELRNMLLYDLLPLIRSFLPVKLAAHLALYVTAMRLFHGLRTLGDETEIIAKEFMINYYRDHQSFCTSSFEDCNSEYARVTRLSQDQADDQNDDDSIQDPINIINSSMTNIRSSKIDRTHLSSSTSSSPRISTCAQISEKIDVEGMLNSLFFNVDFNCDHLVYTIFVRSISTASAVFEK